MKEDFDNSTFYNEKLRSLQIHSRSYSGPYSGPYSPYTVPTVFIRSSELRRGPEHRHAGVAFVTGGRVGG